MYEKYNWRFDEDIVDIFDEHISRSIPIYVATHNTIAQMSPYFAQRGTNIVDIGTSTGVLIDRINEINKSRNVHCIGIDTEQAMIDKCKEKYKDIEFKLCDATEFEFENCSMVTSVFSLQFMEKENRRVILKNIYNGLKEDGALFIAEKVKTDILDIHDIYNDLYYDFKRNGLTDEEILDKNASLRGIMKPVTLEENIEMLKEAGFTKINVFIKLMNFVGIVAIK